MAVGHTLILYQITVVRNLSHPLNLGRFFMLEFGTRLCSNMQAPCLAVRGEFIPLHSVIPNESWVAMDQLNLTRPLSLPRSPVPLKPP
jgi:hypothetical protein